VPVGRLLNKPI